MNIFTYGTLMTGQCRNDWFLPLVRWQHQPAVTPGSLYSLWDSFPAMSVGDTTIIGEVVTPIGEFTDDHQYDFDAVERMEANAGYHTAEIDVKLTDPNVHPSRQMVQAKAFLMTPDRIDLLVANRSILPIPGGDWATYERSLWQR